MIKSYIWDFDGTLYDSYPIMLKAFMDTLKSYGIHADECEVYRLLKAQSSKAVAEKYHLDFEAFTKTFKSFEAADQRIPVSYENTREVLAEIVALGHQNFILTHRVVDSTHELLMREGLLEYITEIVGPENNFPRKPDPASLNYLVHKYDLHKDETVMIGDRTMDIDAGIHAGVKTMFYDNEHLLPDIHADYTMHSMQDTLAFLKNNQD